MTDWISGNFLQICLFALGLCVVAIIAMSISGNNKYHAFMSECQLDHKAYECEMKWAVASGKAQANAASSAMVGGMVGGMIGSAGR